MNKFLLRLLGFGLFSVFIYVSFLSIAYTALPKRLFKNIKYVNGFGGNLYDRLKDADTTRNVDVLILGSSHAYRSFDPRLFKEKGISIFNLGSSSQSFIQTKYVLERYFDQFSPKLVLIECYPVVLNLDGVESSLDFISNSRIDCSIFKMAEDVNNIKVYNTLIYGVINQWLNLSSRNDRPMNTDKYIKGGYVQTFEKLNDSSIGNNFYEPQEYKISPKQKEALVEIVNYLKSKSTPFYLVQMPITQSRFKSYTNVDEIDKFYENYGRHINFNNQVVLADSMFYDDHHLNQYGVNAITDNIIRQIPELEKLSNE